LLLGVATRLFDHDFVDIIHDGFFVHFLVEHQTKFLLHPAAHAFELQGTGHLSTSKFIPIEPANALKSDNVSALTLIIMEEYLVRSTHKFHLMYDFQVL